MHHREAQVIAGVLWFLVCAGIVRFVMTRIGWWLGFAGIWLAVLVGLGALWLYDDRVRARNAEHPVVVIARDTGCGEETPTPFRSVWTAHLDCLAAWKPGN